MNDKKDWRAIQLLYDQMAVISEERRCYLLSDREVAMLLSQSEYLLWPTRWYKAGDARLTTEETAITLQWAAHLRYNLMNPLLCAGMPEAGDCVEFAPDQALLTYAPQDPFRSPNYTPHGYLLPPFSVVSVTPPFSGLQVGDVLITLASIPLGANWNDLLTDGLPRFRVTFSGMGTVELHLLNIPQGGLAFITNDGNPLTLETADLNRDATSAPPETVSVTIVERKFETPGSHFIDVTFVPNVNDSLIPVFFGGGLRKVVLCGEGITGVMPQIEMRFQGCNLQVSYDGGETFTTVPGWQNAANCFAGTPINDVEAVTLPPGSEATANLSGGVLTLGIPRGADGQDGTDGTDGQNGTDGRTPVFTSAFIDDEKMLYWRYVDEPETANRFLFGVRDGADGTNGTDGRTPVLTSGKIGNKTEFYWRYADEPEFVQRLLGSVFDGADGTNGTDGRTPVLTSEKIGNETKFYWRYADEPEFVKRLLGSVFDGADGAQGEPGVCPDCGDPDMPDYTQDGRCLASANVTAALRALTDQMITLAGQSSTLAAFYAAILGIMALASGVSLELAPLFFEVAIAVFNMSAEQLQSLFSDNFFDELNALLYEHASESGRWDSIAYTNLLADIDARATADPNGGRQWQWIGLLIRGREYAGEGINKLIYWGNITEADCSNFNQITVNPALGCELISLGEGAYTVTSREQPSAEGMEYFVGFSFENERFEHVLRRLLNVSISGYSLRNPSEGVVTLEASDLALIDEGSGAMEVALEGWCTSGVSIYRSLTPFSISFRFVNDC